MSLSSFLLPSKAGNTLDKELDSLFFKKKQQQNDSVAGPSSRTTATLVKATKDNGKKRKGGAGDAREEEEPSKRRKDESRRAEEKTTKEGKAGKNDKKGKARGSDDEEDDAGLEDAYLMAHEPQPVEEETEAEAEEEEADDDDNRDDVLVHESLKKKNKKTSSRPKTKYVPPSETPEQRNQRTIFIGNLSTSVAQKRSLQKQLHRHILQYIPTAKIESTRFRSVPFATPTSNLAVDTDKSPSTTTSTASKSTTTTRQHDISRTSAWRTNHHHPSSAAGAFTTSESDPKSFLTPSQKKKIAFINHEFHASADAVNAYIVFAHPLPVPVPVSKAETGARWPPNLPPPREVMDPYEAARGAAGRCDGTVFMERLLRVDLVGGGGAGGKPRVGEEAELLAGAGAGAGAGADPKLSIFVGNLDFASREDEVRVFFEGVVGKERGERLAVEGSADGDGNGNGKKRGWVTRVRIVRDKETQMGKGFAYVQFADRECVDEILALEEGTLKFAKRKLRVQRCKTVPGASTSTRQITAQAGHGKQPARRGSDEPSGAGPANKSRGRAVVPMTTPVPIVPKGDPALGAKLAGLSKDARKQAKAVDADRVARRLAKKKARMAMQTTGAAGVKLGRMDGGGGGAKERQRVRKSGKGGAVNAGTGKKKVRKAKSGRVRSEKAIAKMNGKKTQAA